MEVPLPAPQVILPLPGQERRDISQGAVSPAKAAAEARERRQLLQPLRPVTPVQTNLRQGPPAPEAPARDPFATLLPRSAAGTPSAPLPSTPFLAQLIAQGAFEAAATRNRPLALEDRRFRQGRGEDDPAGAAEPIRDRPINQEDAGIEAYRRTAQSEREFFARRYQVLRDADGTFIVPLRAVDITV